MNKKNESVKVKDVENDVIDKRSEIKGKANSKKGTTVVKKKAKNDLEQTMAIDTVELMRKANTKKATDIQKRSEINGKVAGKKKKIEVEEIVDDNKVKQEDNVEIVEDDNDTIQENVENVSLAMIAMLVLFCVVFLFVLGYMLSKIALTNSDAIALIFRGLWYQFYYNLSFLTMSNFLDVVFLVSVDK